MSSSKCCKSADYVIMGSLYVISAISLGSALFGDGDSLHHLLAVATFAGLALVFGRLLKIEKRLNLADAQKTLESPSET